MVRKSLDHCSWVGKWFVSFLILTIPIGCLKLTKIYPEKRTYLIELKAPEPIASNPKKSKLKIKRVFISSKFESKSFIYRKSNNIYETDFYNEFLISPQNNISEEIQKYLDRKKIFKAVLLPNTRMDTNFDLEIIIYSLYGDFRNSSQPYAFLEMQFKLYEESLLESKLILQMDYNKKIQIQNDSPESLVEGWSQGLKEILENYSKELIRLEIP